MRKNRRVAAAPIRLAELATLLLDSFVYQFRVRPGAAMRPGSICVLVPVTPLDPDLVTSCSVIPDTLVYPARFVFSERMSRIFGSPWILRQRRAFFRFVARWDEHYFTPQREPTPPALAGALSEKLMSALRQLIRAAQYHQSILSRISPRSSTEDECAPPAGRPRRDLPAVVHALSTSTIAESLSFLPLATCFDYAADSAQRSETADGFWQDAIPHGAPY